MIMGTALDMLPYVSSVSVIRACPSWSATKRMSAPAESNDAAYVCRVEWNFRGTIFAAFSVGCHTFSVK